ncbi:hypothetical protein SH1V18_14820 [Vallitalea longa]|uniref:KAP NTPase domain-containing protein n=1 Tax=Vallitalea longa TaxID=2936439 RepID=A0A9W5Y8B0_9FIRM|nr:P-loop NTPase fold protein [Vallitalea longa]GKX29002.1 hypothetical protein SH1V18_14820 [Vallitalea longa]
MRQHSKKNNYTYINHSILLKSFCVGALISELFILLSAVDRVFWEFAFFDKKQYLIWPIRVIYYFIIICYLGKRNFYRKMKMLIKSLRFDLLIILVWGGILVFAFGGIGIISFENLIRTLSLPQLSVIFMLPIIISISFFLKNLQARFMKKPNKDSFFMSDKECKNKDDDKFNFIDKVEKFCEKVYDEKSSEGLVFGIDAPWGTGKSTFVNFCKEYWNEKYKNEIIVYTFNPLRYENKEKMLDKFISGFINEIKKHVFVPEIEWLISKYATIIKDSKPSFSIMGFGFKLPTGNKSIDDIFEKLEVALANIDNKIIIIIDDLDRLNFSAIKEVLFVIKKVFTLSNISYVLCYDTDNIAKLEKTSLDNEKIIEFLEKFINVKTSIYIDNKLLLDYFIVNKDRSLSENILIEPVLVSKAIEGIIDIFESKDYYRYLPFIGNPRKLKRLINTILLLDIEKTDFDNSDFNKQDLIHLLLIYIYYPNIFRNIYITETKGKKGFFSVAIPYDGNKPENEVEYESYLKNLTQNQKFILNKVFLVKERISNTNNSPEMLTSYACFNGSQWNDKYRNLERYLNLINNISYPIKTDQYRFYTNCVNEVLYEKSIEEVLAGKEFSLSCGEKIHEQFWRAVVNSTSYKEFTYEKSREIISYAVYNLNSYSLINIKDFKIGFRKTLIIFIVKLLNDVGWFAKVGKYPDNMDINKTKIAEWIFGEGDYKGNGILEILGQKNKGVLGLYDLLCFRLFCIKDRGLNIYNLTRSLCNHADPKMPTSGYIKNIVINEMREISQNIFIIFKFRYIEQKINVFHEIDKLKFIDLCGYQFNYSKDDEQKINSEVINLKCEMISFIIYQLGNTIIDDSGICCGYYDVIGKEDKKGINKEINNYLFEFCFKSNKNNMNNYKYFLQYLLTHLSRINYVFDKNQIFNVLDKDLLIKYWKKECNIIKAKFKINDININNSKEDLINVYKVLDELLQNE